jgi:hypothetical protein
VGVTNNDRLEADRAAGARQVSVLLRVGDGVCLYPQTRGVDDQQKRQRAWPDGTSCICTTWAVAEASTGLSPEPLAFAIAW